MKRHLRCLAPYAFFLALTVNCVFGSTFTPLAWQQLVQNHSNPKFIGQRKHTTWVRDLNRNFIDDEIESRFKPGGHVNVILDLNRCMSPGQIKDTFARFGRVVYASRTISTVYLNDVLFDSLRSLSERPEVAMIEWQAPNTPEAIDTASRAIDAHSSHTYAGSAQDNGLDGTGVVVAVVGTGVSDTANSGTNGFAQLNGKLVAGYDATNPSDPGDGSTDPPDVETYHESLMAAIIVGAPAPAGITCRTPNDRSPANCAGIASGAKYVNVRQCSIDASGVHCDSTSGAKALDWVAANAQKFNIRVVNMSFSESCVSDDGTSASAQQANYLVALGMVAVVAAERSWSPMTPPGCTPPFTITLGEQWVTAAGSGSFTIQATGSDDNGTVIRTDDLIWSNYTTGPRIDFNFQSPDVLALKPDIAAPGQNLTVYQSGTTVISGISGTSPATAIVSGAAALLLQKFNQEITPDSLKQLLLTGVDPSHNTPYGTMTGPWGNWDKAFGWGILNVGGALQAASAQSTDVTFPNCVTGAVVGSPCNLANGAPSWDNEVDITTPSTPQQGVPTTINVAIYNAGPSVATNVLVNFGVYDFATATPEFYHIGTQVVATINPGQTITVPQAWTPSMDSHQCIQISIAYGLDSNYTNNVTQRNFFPAPSLYHVRVENPFFVPTTYEVKATSARDGWVCRTNRTSFQLQPEDCPFDLQVTFEAPRGTKPNERAKCHVAVYATPQGGAKRLTGGVTAETYVPQKCKVYGQVVAPSGAPVDHAQVTFIRLDHLEEAVHPERQEDREASVRTDDEGVFGVEITPDILVLIRIEREGVGQGEFKLRPSCGLSLNGLVLHPNEIEIKPVTPGVIQGTREKTGEARSSE
jgi:hypothetical protein